MTKCYGHEECEFNGQPECRLPDGMECPHGAKADKPVAESKTDIEALIERLNQYSQSLIAFHMGGEFSDMFADAATALSTLRVENEKLRAELEQAKAEHDAAISDLETIMAYGGGNLDTCQYCKNGQCYARGGTKLCLPQWRGQKEG